MTTASISPPTTPRGLPTTESRFVELLIALGIPSDFRIVDRDTYDVTPRHLRQTLTGRGGRMVQVAWPPHEEEPAEPEPPAEIRPPKTWSELLGGTR